MSDILRRIRNLELSQRIVFFAIVVLVLYVVVWILDFVLSLDFLAFAIVAYFIYQLFIKKD